MPLELKQQRSLPVTINGSGYVYTIRPIAAEEYLQYFDSALLEEELKDGVVTRNIDSAACSVELLNKVLLNVSGYDTGDRPISEIENWRELLPLSHRQSVANLLFEVGNASEKVKAPVMLGAERVRLEALWSADDSGKNIAKHSDLVHTFRVPSLEQQRRFSRDSSRSRVIGGRKGKTQYLGAQRTLVALYDELIQSVTGYSLDGRTEATREEWIAGMDALHKIQAMGAVFAPAQIDEAQQ